MRGWGTASYEDIPESQHVFWAGILGQGAHVVRDSLMPYDKAGSWRDVENRGWV